MSAITLSLKNVRIGSRQQLPQLRSTGRRGLRCYVEATNSTGAAKVKFSVTQHVEFGQQVEVTGETETLGLWEQSVPLTWTEGDVWTGECELAPGAVEYKYVIKTVDGTLVGWQPGNNKVIKVDKPGVEVSVNDGWDMPIDNSPDGGNGTETMLAAASSAAAAAAASSSAGNSGSPFPSVDNKADSMDLIEMVIDAAEDIVEDVVEEINEMKQEQN